MRSATMIKVMSIYHRVSQYMDVMMPIVTLLNDKSIMQSWQAYSQHNCVK